MDFQFSDEDLNKMFYSFLSALVFIIVSLPQAYCVTTTLSGTETAIVDCPTPTGHLAHTLIFFLLTFAMIYIMNRWMNRQTILSVGQIVNYSLISALVFYLISNSEMYLFTSSILPGATSACPDFGAIVLHGLIYGLILFGIMYLPE